MTGQLSCHVGIKKDVEQAMLFDSSVANGEFLIIRLKGT